MKKVEGYRVVYEVSCSMIGGSVMEMIYEGWQPYGSPFEKEGCVAQAMVKYQDESDGLTEIADAIHRLANAIEKKQIEEKF